MSQEGRCVVLNVNVSAAAMIMPLNARGGIWT